MRKMISVLAALAVVGLMAGDLFAQRPERPGGRPGGQGGPGGPGGFRPQMPPIMVALDADKDGEISSEEIKNAVKALQSLDKNNDGKLTRDELFPSRGQGGPGGPGGRGFPGRPGGEGGAGGRGGFNSEAIIDRIFENDKNKDGKLTKEELGERGARLLDRADANKDGAVTKDELKKSFENFRPGGGGRGGAGGRAGRPGGEGGEGGRPRRPRPDTE